MGVACFGVGGAMRSVSSRRRAGHWICGFPRGWHFLGLPWASFAAQRDHRGECPEPVPVEFCGVNCGEVNLGLF